MEETQSEDRPCSSGSSAITAGLSWVYSVQSFKTHFAQEASSTGGLIGQEWKGKESDIINGIIVMGTGHFFVIIAGILAVFAYAVEKVYRKQEPPLEIPRINSKSKRPDTFSFFVILPQCMN